MLHFTDKGKLIMLPTEYKKAVAGREARTNITYDIVNNFTEESIIQHLNTTYGAKVEEIIGDPEWYGRGTCVGKDLHKIPDDWEERLSEGFEELEFFPDEDL
jgi:hypothetical protein